MTKKLSGSQIGSKNAARPRFWSEALQKELQGTRNAPKLRKLAKSLIKKAQDGDMIAMKEIGDRIEGKTALPIINEGAPFIIQVNR